MSYMSAIRQPGTAAPGSFKAPDQAEYRNFATDPKLNL